MTKKTIGPKRPSRGQVTKSPFPPKVRTRKPSPTKPTAKDKVQMQVVEAALVKLEEETVHVVRARQQGVLEGALVLFGLAAIASIGAVSIYGPNFWGLVAAVSTTIAALATAEAADRNAEGIE